MINGIEFTGFSIDWDGLELELDSLVLVDGDSVSAVYDGLRYIYAHYEDYDPASIRKYVEDHFSREAVMRKYTGLIRGICNDKS